MRINKRYKVGSLYYECGLVPDLNGKFVPWIQTWVYMGFVHRPESAHSCDKPNYYYYFKKFDPGMAHTTPDKWETTGLLVPSLQQAMRTKLTWRQMLAYGLPRMLQEIANNNDDSATH